MLYFILGFLSGIIFLFLGSLVIAKYQASKYPLPVPSNIQKIRDELDKKYAVELIKIRQQAEDEKRKLWQDIQKKLENI